MSKIMGIDVSEHNGYINWAKVKNAGIGFAIIRTGYGRSSEDSYFKANIEGAISQRIPVGVYHFSYALDADGARREAEFVVSLLSPYKDKITLPVFYDFEYDTVAYAGKKGVTLGREAFNNHTIAFCEKVKAAGYKAGVYYNLDYYNRFVDMSRLKSYARWYAQYNSTADIKSYDLWQYSSSGTVNGISGRVDMNSADETFVTNGKPVSNIGWKKDDRGWWYVYDEDTSYYKSRWAMIDGAYYYFDEEGYMVKNKFQLYDGDLYYLGEDGKPVTSGTLKVGADGKVVPVAETLTGTGDNPSDWAKEATEWAKAQGVFNGDGEGNFGWQMPITREQVAQVLYNLYGK